MISRHLPGALALSLLPLHLLAQCPTPPTWTALGQQPAPAGSVFAMVSWDPDGPGPLGQHFVCGGDFAVAGAASTASIALLEPVSRTWSALGAGFDGPVTALAVLPNGSLIAAGSFQFSGATSIAHVAQWNGAGWVALGSGTNGDVRAATALPNGDLVVGGLFSAAGGTAASNLARWNGTTWSALGGGVSGTPSYLPSVPQPPTIEPVTFLGARSNGDLIVAGEFATAGGIASERLARWNGTAWSGLGLALVSTRITALRVLPNDDVAIGTNDFLGSSQAMRWNGTTWSTLGGTSVTSFDQFVEQPNGTLLAARGDSFTSYTEVVAWTGTSWSSTASPWVLGPATALLATSAVDLWIAGMLWAYGASSVQHFDGQAWRAAAAGLDGWVTTAVSCQDDLVISGFFKQVDNTDIENLAIRHNGVWSPVGGGVSGWVSTLLASRSGRLIVGGEFTLPPSTTTHNVARWDGQTWSSMGTPPGVVIALADAANGDVLAGGYYPAFVVRWNGSTWTQLGTIPPTNYQINVIAELPNGDIVAGSSYASGAKVLLWSNGVWAPLGHGFAATSPFDEINRICVLPNGDVVVAGNFVQGNLFNVARWDGIAWQPMGAGLPSRVSDLDLLPGGDLLATHGNVDSAGQIVVSPSRWNGTAWVPVPGIGRGVPWRSTEQATIDSRGEVSLVGTFTHVQNAVAGGLASLATGCPAGLVSAGAGCNSTLGPVTLLAQSRAWLGDTYRAITFSSPTAIDVNVFGLGAASLPLANVLPQALPGCTLHVSPDVLIAAIPTNGASTVTWAIPASPSLLAQTFRHQAIPFEFSASGALTAIAASNAWQLTIGAW